MPGDVLLSTGVQSLPIELAATQLNLKSRQANHPFDIEVLKDLPKALRRPVAVFSYGDKSKAQNIIVEIQYHGDDLLIGLHLNQKRNGLEVNDIRGLFPKVTSNWLNWIEQGKALYLDKERVQAKIDQLRTNLAEVKYPDLNSVTKVVENFENPKSPEMKPRGTRFREAADRGDLLAAADIARDGAIDPKPSMRIGIPERGKMPYGMEPIEVTNERFNRDLDALTPENANSIRLNIGMPSEALLMGGVKPYPILLYGNKLLKKSRAHAYTKEMLRDLPLVLQNPLGVFDTHGEENSRVVLTEIKHPEGHTVVALKVANEGNKTLNILTSVYGKDPENISQWISNGYLTYGDEETILRQVRSSVAPIAGASVDEGSFDTTNVINNSQIDKTIKPREVRFREAADRGDLLAAADIAREGAIDEKVTRQYGEIPYGMEVNPEWNGEWYRPADVTGRTLADIVGLDPAPPMPEKTPGQTLAEWADEMTAYNNDPRVRLRTGDLGKLPKTPEPPLITEEMSVHEVAELHRKYNEECRQFSEKAMLQMQALGNPLWVIYRGLMDANLPLERWQRSVASMGIQIPESADMYNALLREASQITNLHKTEVEPRVRRLTDLIKEIRVDHATDKVTEKEMSLSP